MPQKILGLPTPLTMTTALKSRISKALHLGLYTIAKIAWWTLNPDQFHAWYQPMKLNHHHTPPPENKWDDVFKVIEWPHDKLWKA